MKAINFLILLGSILFLVVSCNKKTIQQLNSTSQRDFSYLIGKGKIRFTDLEDNKQNASLQLKIQKDSVVWGNISKSVVQVARFSILSDSIFLLDKLKRKYIPRDISSLNQGIKINFNEKMIENLFLGNLILPVDEKTKIRKDKITQQVDRYIIISTFNKQTKKILSVSITEPNTLNRVDIHYSDYQIIDRIIFPKKTSIDGQFLQEKLVKTSILIELSKVSLPTEKPSFSFKVPSSYEKI